jgi:hypothetical protein
MFQKIMRVFPGMNEIIGACRQAPSSDLVCVDRLESIEIVNGVDVDVRRPQLQFRKRRREPLIDESLQCLGGFPDVGDVDLAVIIESGRVEDFTCRLHPFPINVLAQGLVLRLADISREDGKYAHVDSPVILHDSPPVGCRLHTPGMSDRSIR